MKLVLSLLLCITLLIPPGMCDAESFCYEEENCGPNHWKGVCNTGSNQSPIDIPVTMLELRNAKKADFYFSYNYGQEQGFDLKNNGHTIQVSTWPNPTSTSFMHGANLNGKKYIFSQLHFHWGSNKRSGSEHSINKRTYGLISNAPIIPILGIIYPMEGHFVHYSSEFDSLQAAIESKQPDALAVIGVFYMTTIKDNPGFSPLIETMKKLKKAGDSRKGMGLTLVKLLPRAAKFFSFQYNGSLTTPGCDEVVLWNVLGVESHISEEQLNEFRRQLDAHDGLMQNNFRPIQPLNNREIRVYIHG